MIAELIDELANAGYIRQMEMEQERRRKASCIVSRA